VTNDQPRFLSLAGRTIVAHTLTYILMGAIASHFFDYAAAYANPCSGMRPFTSAWILAGPMLQPLRALIFAAVFYPFRERLFGTRYGWLFMAWMLIGLGILSTFAPASGSVEGIIYTTTPVRTQLRGWLEIMPQAFLFAALLSYWVNHAEKKWLSWTLGTLFVLAMSLFALGLLEMSVMGVGVIKTKG
jgi:hypothetical protein